MQKDTWIIIGVLVTLVGLLATFMVTSLTSIESRLTAMDNNFSARLATMDSRLHEMNTRLSRIEGHLRLPTDIEPIQFETIDEAIIFKEDGQLVFGPVARSLPLGEVMSQLARMEENPARSLMSTGHWRGWKRCAACLWSANGVEWSDGYCPPCPRAGRFHAVGKPAPVGRGLQRHAQQSHA